MNDEQKVVAAEDRAAAQAALFARIRKCQERSGLRVEKASDGRNAVAPCASVQERAQAKVQGGGLAADPKGLAVRKDAELGDVIAAWGAFRKVFDNFALGTGYLARELRGPVNDFEATVMIKAGQLKSMFEKAARS